MGFNLYKRNTQLNKIKMNLFIFLSNDRPSEAVCKFPQRLGQFFCCVSFKLASLCTLTLPSLKGCRRRFQIVRALDVRKSRSGSYQAWWLGKSCKTRTESGWIKRPINKWKVLKQTNYRLKADRGKYAQLVGKSIQILLWNPLLIFCVLQHKMLIMTLTNRKSGE